MWRDLCYNHHRNEKRHYVQDTQKPDTELVVERWKTRDALAPQLKKWREKRGTLVRSTKVEIIQATQIETLEKTLPIRHPVTAHKLRALGGVFKQFNALA